MRLQSTNMPNWQELASVEGLPLLGGCGRLIGSVAGDVADLRPGDALLHAAGVPHPVQAVGDSQWLEFKTPRQSP